MFLIAYVGTAILVTLFVMGVAAKLAKEKGKNPFKWAGLSFLALFVFMFWDYYPTQWAHQYYCEKEAGFWVYKTLEQWKAENPGVMESLVEDKTSRFVRAGDDEDHTDTQMLNQRFRWITEKHSHVFLLPVYSLRSEIVDSKNGEVVARQVDFPSGRNRGHFKFWMGIESCPNGTANREALYHFVESIVKVNKGEIK